MKNSFVTRTTMTDHLTSRAQRLIEEFEEGESVREGIANVLLHLAVTWDNYSDGDEYWHGVTVDTLGEFATELTAPTLLDRALAGDKDAALAQPEPQGPTDEELRETYRAAYAYACENRQGPAAQVFGLRAVLAKWGRPAIEPDGPAVLGSREPASVTDQPTDKELLELMPETMRDEFSYAARTCSDAMGGRVKPGIFRVALNTAALEYAQAVLQRYGRPAIEPVPTSERPWEREGWCDAKGMCYGWDGDYWWMLGSPRSANELITHWLPHWALPVPQEEAE